MNESEINAALYVFEGEVWRLRRATLPLEVKDKLGVSRQTLHNWRSGKVRPSGHHAEVLMELYPRCFERVGVYTPGGEND